MNHKYVPESIVTADMPPTSFIGNAVTKNAGIAIQIATKHIGITIYPDMRKNANGMHKRNKKFENQGIMKTGS